MSERSDRGNYFLAFGWVTASMAGAVVGWVFLTGIVQRFLPFDILFSLPWILVVRGAVVGTVLGFFQWRSLERLHAAVDHWVLRTATAYTISSSLLGIVTTMLPLVPLTRTGRALLEVPILFAGGTIMGALQSTGFGASAVNRRIWVIAMGLGWTLGAILPFALPGLGRFAYFPNAVTFALWGIGIGVATLYPLRKLLREA